jgi:hypothetical protein
MPRGMTNLATLLQDRPAIHGAEGATDLQTHGLLEEALELIERMVGAGDHTLETGSGYSTLLFALLGAEHTCIVPNQPEVDRIKAYCTEKGISTERLSFHVEPSERVLPRLELEPLSLVLIDGSHSFPQVFIDWFYTAQALRLGGCLLVDDVHVWTGRVLRDFLAAEPEWRLDDELGGRTAVFTKLADVDPDKVWTDQPYVARRTQFGAATAGRMAWSMLRHGHGRELAARARSAAARRVGR